MSSTPPPQRPLATRRPSRRPDDTPWEDGTFKLHLEFTEEYPNKAPVVKFLTKMFHPNSARPCSTHAPRPTSRHPHARAGAASVRHFVSSLPRARIPPPRPPAVYADGSICLDILQNQWSPIYDISAILTSIQSLLCDPNPNSPANSEAARLYQENRREYERKVKEIVEQSWSVDEEGS